MTSGNHLTVTICILSFLAYSRNCNACEISDDWSRMSRFLFAKQLNRRVIKYSRYNGSHTGLGVAFVHIVNVGIYNSLRQPVEAIVRCRVKYLATAREGFHSSWNGFIDWYIDSQLMSTTPACITSYGGLTCAI